MNKITLDIPEKLAFFVTEKARYKVAWGGRGGAKSWAVARSLLYLAIQRPTRILCVREIQKSISESVHALLSDQIAKMGLSEAFEVLKTEIRCRNGSEFLFTGLRDQDAAKIKSFEGADVAWVEEAHIVGKRSWDILVPTIRKPGSEIWVTFNPENEDDETFRRFITYPPPDAIVVKANWNDNPWFPAELEKERLHLKATDPEAYRNVWEGECRSIIEGAIYRNELERADNDGRIGVVPHDPRLRVHTAWDLGVGDATAIWFYQQVGREVRLIDYHEASGEGLPYYAGVLAAKERERGFIYGEHLAPHDIQVREFSSGRSRIETAASLGIRFRTVRMTTLEDGIHAVRMLFPLCWFDTERCKIGIKGLRSYRWERNERLNEFKPRPVHDWASHCSDAFRMLAVAHVTEDDFEESRPSRQPYHEGRSQIGGY